MEVVDVKSLAPMRALRIMRRGFPDALQRMDEVCRDKADIPGWDQKRCYCPVGMALAYFTDYVGTEDYESIPIGNRLDMATNAKALAVLASWRQTKSVYVLDHSLAEEFLRMDVADVDVSSDTLQIPAYCIYLRTDVFDSKIDGFYVMFDCDVTRKHMELYIVPSNAEGNMGAPIYLILPPEPAKISDVLASEANEAIRDGFRAGLPKAVRGGQVLAKAFNPYVGFVINALLYLCATNADIKANTHTVRRKAVIPKDTAIYDVGPEAGLRVRTFNQSVHNDGSKNTPLGGHHKSPVMHIRRAHYHTFLVGKGRKERRVKWLPPIFVNADGGKTDLVTVTKVKK